MVIHVMVGVGAHERNQEKHEVHVDLCRHGGPNASVGQLRGHRACWSWARAPVRHTRKLSGHRKGNSKSEFSVERGPELVSCGSRAGLLGPGVEPRPAYRGGTRA